MRRFAVIGLGRFGSQLAMSLAIQGAEVLAIDQDRQEVERLRDQVTLAVCLDSTDELALKSQGLEKVDVAIVCMGQVGFEAAILTVVNLKQIGIAQIFARAETHIAGQVFLKIGATDVIYPEIESAQRWGFKLIAPQITDKIDFAPGYSLARVKAPASFHNKTIQELQLRKRFNVNLVMIRRNTPKQNNQENIINVPLPTTVIYQGDLMMLAGADVNLATLPRK